MCIVMLSSLLVNTGTLTLVFCRVNTYVGCAWPDFQK